MKTINNECIIHWNEAHATVQFPGYSYHLPPHSNLIVEISNIRKTCTRNQMLGMLKDNIVFSVHRPHEIDLDRYGYAQEEETIYSMVINVEKLFDMIIPKIHEYMSDSGMRAKTVLIGKRMGEAMVNGELPDFRLTIFKRGIPEIMYIPEEEGIIVL